MSENPVQETQGERPTGEGIGGISFTCASPTDVYG